MFYNPLFTLGFIGSWFIDCQNYCIIFKFGICEVNIHQNDTIEVCTWMALVFIVARDTPTKLQMEAVLRSPGARAKVFSFAKSSVY